MQVSWIDVDDLNALLARIAPAEEPKETPPPRVVEPVPEAARLIMSEEDKPAPARTMVEPPSPPEEEEAALPLSKMRDKLRSIRQLANAAGILARPERKIQPPPAPPRLPFFALPVGDQEERLEAFGAWARTVLREDGGHVLVMNDDGELLWGGDSKAGLALSAMMAWNATQRGSAQAAASKALPVVRQTLASGQMLTVISCATSTGVLYHAAVAGPAAVSEEVAQEMRKALTRTMEAA